MTKSIRSILTVGLALAASATPLRAELFQVYQDTASSYTNANKIANYTGTSSLLTISPTAHRKAYIDFGLFNYGILAAQVHAARLTIYFPSVTKGGSLSVSTVNSAWSETFSSNAIPTPTLDSPFVTIIMLTNYARQFVTIDVTDQVKAWLSTPSSEHGLAFVGDNNLSCTISSKENASSGHPAVLEIDRVRLNDGDMYLRGDYDLNHGLGWYGPTKAFAGNEVDGPVLYGYSGGALGSTSGGQKIALKWDSAGLVGIGTSPTARLDIKGTANSEGQGLRLENATVANHFWNMFIDGNGDALVFSFTNRWTFGINYTYLLPNSAGLITTSDRRSKKDIEPLASCLDRVMALKPSTFRYKTAEEGTPLNYGFIAQDIEQQFPDLVQERAGLKTLVTDGVTAINTRAIQDLKREKDAELAKLRAENAALTEKVAALEARDQVREARLTRLEKALEAHPAVQKVKGKVASDQFSLNQ